jgi:hypothetical protein
LFHTLQEMRDKSKESQFVKSSSGPIRRIHSLSTASKLEMSLGCFSMILTVSNPMLDPVRHYNFPVPDAFPHVVRTLANR